MKTCFIVISDAHSGHREGLTNPTSKLTDKLPIKGKPKKRKVGLTAFQEILWGITKDVRRWVNHNCKDYDKWLIHLGETTQGNRFSDNLMTTDMNEQRTLARDTIEPFAKMEGMKGARLLQATSWHEFGDGSMSKLLADELQMKHQYLDVQAINQSMMNVNGFRFLWTHHGPSTSKIKHLEGNSAYNASKNRIFSYMSEKERIPDIVFTAHTHRPSWGTSHILSEGEYITSSQIITPPMCGPGAYSRKVANPEIYYVGMHVVLVDDLNIPKIKPFLVKCTDYILETL